MEDVDILRSNTRIPDLFGKAVEEAQPGTKSSAASTVKRFRPMYLNVAEEEAAQSSSSSAGLTPAERRLLAAAGGGGGGGGGGEDGRYEKSAPAHGDVHCHKFLSAVRENPGQVLRYS